MTVWWYQPKLPFLTLDDATTIDAARTAVRRAEEHALAGRRVLDAAELRDVGDRLVDMLERNAAAVRAQ